ncbi:MAG: ribonuclease HII [Candidatus Woesearchaeota archaeon]
MKLCGIDEAGRGAVVGPLVLCGVLIDEKEEGKLKELGVKDSKLLSPKQRERIASALKKIVKYQLIVLSPKEIDDNVGGNNGSNLNWLEANKAVELVNILQPDKVIIDCPSPNTKAYHEYIVERLLHKKTKIITEHKADFKYPVVAAASILAKVERDAAIEQIKKHVGVDVGPGYPANPITKAFVEKYWDKHPEIFRHSWSTYKEAAGLKKQKKIGEY